MIKTLRLFLTIRTLIMAFFVISTLVDAQDASSHWYVQAGATGDGKSRATPMGTLLELERVSDVNDHIFLLASATALEGGLVLKDGQQLVGLSIAGEKPVVKNTNPKRLNGIGIKLANNNRVSNVRIEDTYASGVYGEIASAIFLDKVDVYRANQNESYIQTKYPTLPGNIPHGGMVFIHSNSVAEVFVNSSTVTQSAGFGIVSITSGTAHSLLSISHTQVEGGSKIGFFDVGISALVQDPEAKVRLNVSDSQVWGRLSRSGRNIMVVASGGAKADARIERSYSGITGQDGIVTAVMQSPSLINLYIGDSLIEGAGQMNVEGSLINLPSRDPKRPNEGKVSIEIEKSTIRNAGEISGFEEVAANVWLGASQFIDENPPAEGVYRLKVINSRIENAGRSGLELGNVALSKAKKYEKSSYDVHLHGNTIVNNGQADVMIYAPNAKIVAQQNCWGSNKGLLENRVVVISPAKFSQINATNPAPCKVIN